MKREIIPYLFDSHPLITTETKTHTNLSTPRSPMSVHTYPQTTYHHRKNHRHGTGLAAPPTQFLSPISFKTTSNTAHAVKSGPGSFYSSIFQHTNHIYISSTFFYLPTYLHVSLQPHIYLISRFPPFFKKISHLSMYAAFVSFRFFPSVCLSVLSGSRFRGLLDTSIIHFTFIFPVSIHIKF